MALHDAKAVASDRSDWLPDLTLTERDVFVGVVVVYANVPQSALRYVVSKIAEVNVPEEA